MSYHEKLMEARDNMKVVQQRQMTRDQKIDLVRLSLVEDHLSMMAKAIEVLLEMKERGL